jgi:D-alanine-D-alanine ligase
MRIGITYDLREEHLALGASLEAAAEFDSPRTIDAIAAALARLGHEPVRIGSLRSLVAALATGARWDLVFNIAEGSGRYARESQVPALLEGYGIECTFSDALVCAVTLHKAVAKRLLRDQGVPTPEFAVVERLDDVDAVTLPLPLFAKPVAEGTSKGITAASRITERGALRRVCADLLARFAQPVLVERYLPGREFTVGLLGTGARAEAAGVLAVELLAGADPDVYTFRNKEDCEELVRYSLATGPVASEAAALALAAWRAIGGRDAGRVDVRQNDAGRLEVIEVNPLPGLNPGHSDLPILCELAGIGYGALIERIVASACERIAPAAALRA